MVKRTGTGQVQRVTLYDGASILADLDSLGNRQAEYVYDAGTDAPYAMLTGPTTVSATRYYVQDDFGNVTGQFADSVNATEKVSYGDWGLPTINGETTNRITWKGLSYDPDVGLTYVRARWYDPNIGRFVSEDPLGLQGGVNPYVFANNDPINGSDPSGMLIDFGDDGDNNETPHFGGATTCQGKSLVNYNPNTGIISSVIYSWQECTFTPAPVSLAGTSGGGASGGAKPKTKYPSCTTARAVVGNLGRQLSDFGTTTTRMGIGVAAVSGAGAIFAPEALPAEAGGAELGVGLINLGSAASRVGATLAGYGQGRVTGATIGFVRSTFIDVMSTLATRAAFPGATDSARRAFAALLGGVPDALHQAEAACGSR